MQGLIDYLKTLPAGPVEKTRDLEKLLTTCWDSFSNSDAEGMSSNKLAGRMENVRWDSPKLHFVIERHGGTVNGSSRAELHDWTLAMDTKCASCKIGRHRQLEKMNARLDVKPLAREIAQLISERSDDNRITWQKDGTVKVNIGMVIPANCPEQTLQGRRKRFRTELEKLLTQDEWSQLKPNVFSKPL